MCLFRIVQNYDLSWNIKIKSMQIQVILGLITRIMYAKSKNYKYWEKQCFQLLKTIQFFFFWSDIKKE